MASSLNVIALISGGKDSLFSMLHCQANGHTVVALANLYPIPSANDNEDIDSYMYQTVGHSIIPLYEQTLNIPLYRQEITGKAVNSSRDYENWSGQEQDETEDLVPLLEKVIQTHPEANAVSTGAILSTYQRTRVESVALRLGLTPLSYLWQYPILPPYTQSSLLHDMAAVGQEAVIIKTASGGLDESFLGLNVANQRTITKLSKTMARFGEAGNGAIVGEGGEFETLALDGPKSLWKRKIKIENALPEVVEGGQTVLKIKESKLEDKSGEAEEALGDLRIPELFDEEFRKILSTIKDDSNDQALSTSDAESNPLSSSNVTNHEHLPRNTFHHTPTVFTYSNLTSDTQPSPDSTPSRQLTNILLRLDHVLKQCHLSKSHIDHCTLVLRDMSDFTLLNPIYGQFFSAVNPPARVTIAAGSAMPEGIHVMLSIILDKNHESRQGLHVQGRSYWAPANIGPYSQAISVALPRQTDEDAGEVIYIAGQIPLIPASMSVYSAQGFRGQALLSLQHLWRIGRTKGVRWWTAGVGYIPASAERPDEYVKIAQEAWRKIHMHSLVGEKEDDDADGDEAEDVDPWDRINSGAGNVFNDSTYRAPIPDPAAVRGREDGCIPPCFVAQIASLPRDVDIEWSATGLTSSSIHFDNGLVSSPRHSCSKFYAREIREESDVEGVEWTSATLYAGPEFVWDAKRSAKSVQWIPCIRVWGMDGREVSGVIVGRADGEEKGGSVD